ncbi:cytochrome P450 [Polychytrium aggregatum]|uniref:cytochrome P450 n=1 Tax=Polychytrium aggregatum TaxID=110093 RepID=UPI0022FE7A1B|nr:cytochrome P450 [Polychytrium aggregatum]KAI9197144.1 cytochrome P450 [Polychytrium aggregatum]
MTLFTLSPIMLSPPSFWDVAVAVSAMALVSYVYGVAQTLRSPLRKLPGAREHALNIFLGDRLVAMLKSQFLKRHLVQLDLHQRYGPIVLLNNSTISVSDTQLHSYIAFDLDLPKAEIYKLLNIYPEVYSIFSAIDKSYHRMLRRTLSPAFGARSLRMQEPLIEDCLTNFLQSVARSCTGPKLEATVDIWATIRLFTLDVTGLTAFGTEFNMIRNGQHRLPSTINSIFLFRSVKAVFPFIEYLPFLPIVQKRNEDVQYLEDFVFALIRERKSGAVNRSDLLQFIVDAVDPDTGKGLTDKEIFSSVTALLTAGSETTASALAFGLIRIAEDRKVLEKLQSELDAVQLDPSSRLISHSSAKKLPYLNAVIDEIIRIDPTAGAGGMRQADSDISLGSYAIPKGTNINMTIYSAHYDEHYWQNPTQLNPERFLSGNPDVKKHHVPFSLGPRNCIGKEFALIEMRLFLANFVRLFDMRLPDGPPQSKAQVLSVTLGLESQTYKLVVTPRTESVLQSL